MNATRRLPGGQLIRLRAMGGQTVNVTPAFTRTVIAPRDGRPAMNVTQRGIRAERQRWPVS